MYKFLLCSAAAFIFSANASAQMSFAEYSSRTLEKMSNLNQDIFDLSDADFNQKLSRNEIAELAKSAVAAEDFSENKKNELMQQLNDDFDNFDTNHDNWLDRTEGEAYLKNYQLKIIRQQFDAFDSNRDEILSEDEIQTYSTNMVAQKSPEQALQDLEKANNELKKLADNPEQFLGNLISRVANQQAGEEFYQMDSNHDNIASRDEYVDYMLQSPNFQGVKIQKEDMEEIFNQLDINKKGSLNKEEYINAYMQMINSTMNPNSTQTIQ